jgi:hypothetical protein
MKDTVIAWPLWVISGSADHVDGLRRTQLVYLNKRTRAGPAEWGQPWAKSSSVASRNISLREQDLICLVQRPYPGLMMFLTEERLARQREGGTNEPLPHGHSRDDEPEGTGTV